MLFIYLFTQYIFLEDLVHIPENRKDKAQICQEEESDRLQIGKQDNTRWW